MNVHILCVITEMIYRLIVVLAYNKVSVSNTPTLFWYDMDNIKN